MEGVEQGGPVTVGLDRAESGDVSEFVRVGRREADEIFQDLIG